MARNYLTRESILPIYNANGTSFHGLELKKFTVESVVMSLGDKISGDVLYTDNTLAFTMGEYVIYGGVRYGLLSPPTVVKEGVASGGSQSVMTKYSFVFYHPMSQLSNFAFSDIAVNDEQSQYLSQNKTFSWIGNLFDFGIKLNVNLQNTEWVVVMDIPQYETDGVTETSQWKKAITLCGEGIKRKNGETTEKNNVLSFDKNFISEALKTAYDTWEIPFVIDSLERGEYYDDADGGHTDYYDEGKRFVVLFGNPTNEIYAVNGNGEITSNPYIFRFGQGVGLKNNSRTPKNNKIVTRIVGYGSERNIPYGYPQILWEGDPTWNYTLDKNQGGMIDIEIGGQIVSAMSYPIYKGIVNGEYVQLIKHPFTRKNLMPSIYEETVNKKVNPYAQGFNPNEVIIDYYDADGSFPNPIVQESPSTEIHEFETVYPRFDKHGIVAVLPYDENEYMSWDDFNTYLRGLFNKTMWTKRELYASYLIEDAIYERDKELEYYSDDRPQISLICKRFTYSDGRWYRVSMVSENITFSKNVYFGEHSPADYPTWDDSMNMDGKYAQSYFKLVLPRLTFDLYACASIPEKMDINMRSGACIGCTFEVSIDWDIYKTSFYDDNGDFAPHGDQRNYELFPDSSRGEIAVIVKKDLETFGKIMPNIYQMPQAGDEFVLLGISLPLEYVRRTQRELDERCREYMLENNLHYFDYPLKFDNFFLQNNPKILGQIRNNVVLRFQYASEATMALYIKQISIKYGEGVLPQYDITLTDDVELVLNKVGEVTEDVSRMNVQVSELQKYYSQNLIDEINSKLSRVADDVAQGRITFQAGLESLMDCVFYGSLQSNMFQHGLYNGRGWHIDNLGNGEFESLKVRSYLEVVQLLVNRMQGQEGDTVFTDNDQIEFVTKQTINGVVVYTLSLKQKFEGYVTAQEYGNIIKGRINTLAAKESGVSDESNNNTDKQGHDAGGNLYYTSYMHVVGTLAHPYSGTTLLVNQIQVVLFGDAEVPAGRNFEPCEFMTIARVGCIDYSAEHTGQADYDQVVASIKRRQSFFVVSSTDGRISKLTGVNSPILSDSNYGATFGDLPDFVKAFANVRERYLQGRDYIYAQGVVVGDFIKIDTQGRPIVTTVFCGDWVNGATAQSPSIGKGIYLSSEYNPTTEQYETHQVRHNGGMWKCKQHQPVVSGGVTTYYEPKWGSPYWSYIDGNNELYIEIDTPDGTSFARGSINTTLTAHLYCGGVEITDDVYNTDASLWSWTRESETGKTPADIKWDGNHVGVKTITLTDSDFPSDWSVENRMKFACKVNINKQIISAEV